MANSPKGRAARASTMAAAKAPTKAPTKAPKKASKKVSGTASGKEAAGIVISSGAGAREEPTPPDPAAPGFVVVVGVSAGGLQALTEFVAGLATGMDAAVFIVMHLSRTSISDFLMLQLQKFTTLRCELAADAAAVRKGHVYIAAPNLHLLVKRGRIVLGRGPQENRWRPSIDVLFRSAAVAYNTRAIGVVLTGLLDDGTAGMLAIQRSGGTCIVQDPNEAEYPDMPLSVLDHMEVDHCVPLADMGPLIARITGSAPDEKPVPDDIFLESQIAEKVVVDYANVRQLGEKSIYACPDCGGGLWDVGRSEKGRGRIVRYRCHIGHAYSEKDLALKQAEVFESTLWTALRIMEERKTLLSKMQSENAQRGYAKSASDYKDKADAIQVHIDKMKGVLFAAQEAV